MIAIGSYNAAGQILNTTYGNNMTGSYSYNSQMQLSSILVQNVSPVMSLSYTYGGAQDNGRIQGITDNLNSARTTSYTYDELLGLKTAQTLDLTSANTWRLQFSYDRYGNRLSQTPAGGTANMPSSQLVVDPATAMASQDNHVVVIAPDRTELDTTSRWPRQNIGFSEQRWEQYRQPFKVLGIQKGIVRRDDYRPSTVFFIVEAHGPVTTGSYKGYVYSEEQLSPLVRSLNTLADEVYDKKAGHAIAFKQLAKNWYLYREEY